MKSKRISSMIISLLLVSAMVIQTAGCTSGEIMATDLMAGVTPQSVQISETSDTQNSAVIDFSVRLFKASEQSGKSTLISPLSVLYALAMAANGAKEQTLSEMEQLLGMSVSELNLYLFSYMQNLPQGEKYKLDLANSVWFKDDDNFTPNQDFLQTNADYYGADIYKAPFDNQTLNDINNWVNQKTDGTIPKILNEISEDSVMYLINALVFDAEWADPYKDTQVRSGTFTKEDGTKRTVDFMYDSGGSYIEDEKAIGFKKYYAGYKYAFVAMLPNEGVSVSEYVASLSGQSLQELLSNKKSGDVRTSIPKFETEYSVQMLNILKSMGMRSAFDSETANFENLGTVTDKNIYISRVLHKTFISVAEKGTKAGAAIIIDYNAGASGPPEEPKYIYLNRPFVYMLIDCENNIPFFIGTLTDVK